MKAEELRIGNYVQSNSKFFKGDTLRITELKDDHDEKKIQAWCIAPGNRAYGSSNEHLEPIPLTEEWLIKFGFEKSKDDPCPYDDGEFTLKSKRFTVFKKHPITHNSVHGWFINNQNFSEINLKYVHQLQNLYFALTGTELTII